VRTLLDLMRENQEAVRDMRSHAEDVLLEAVTHLNILDSELGEEELIMYVAAELANLDGE